MDALDELLSQAQPRTSAEDDGVRAELMALGRDVSESERPSRARRAMVAIATTAAVAFGGAGVAAAAPAISELFGWAEGVDRVVAVPGTSQGCHLGMVIIPESTLGREDPSYLVARQALLGLSLEDLELTQARIEFESQNAEWSRSSASEQDLMVRLTTVQRLVRQAVEAQGLEVDGFSLKIGQRCTDEVP